MGKRQQKHNGFASNARNSTKGTTRDTLNRQTPVKRNLSDELIENLVSSNELAKTILNAPIEDVLKNGLKIYVLKSDGTEDIENSKRLNDKLDQLDYLEKITKLMIEVRKYGYAVMYINALHGEEKETKEDLGDKYRIKALNIFDKKEIVKIKTEKSKFSFDYGKIKELEVKSYVNNGNYNQYTKTNVHPSRVILSRYNDNDEFIGESIFVSLFDRMVLMDSTEWSIGQLIYRASFLIYKTDKNTMSEIEKTGIRYKEEEINASTLAVIGKDDEMQAINSTSGIDPEKYVNAVLTILSIHTNIPKQRLAGNSAGTLAGAEEDAKKYSEYLKRYFNRYILVLIEALCIVNSEYTKLLKI